MMLADSSGPAAADDVCFGSSSEFQEYVRAFYEAHDPRRGPAEAFESYRRLVDSAHVTPSSVAATDTAARRAAPAPAVQQTILDELHALYPKALENLVTTCLIRYAPRRLGTGEEASLIRSAGTFTKVARRVMGQYSLSFASFLPDEPQLRAVTECREVWASFFGQIPGLEAQQEGDSAATTTDAAAMEEDLVRRIDAASGAVLDAASTVRQFYDGCYRDATPAQRRRAVLWKAVFAADAQLALSVDDMLLRADGDVKQALEAFRDIQERNCERRCLEDHMVRQLGLSADDAVAATRRAMTSRTPGTDLFKSLHYDTHQHRSGSSGVGGGAVVSPSFHSSPEHGNTSTGRHFSPDRRSLLAVEMSKLQHHSPQTASSPAARGPTGADGGVFGSAASLVNAYMRLRHDGRRATPPPSGIISPSAPFSSSLGGVVNATSGSDASPSPAGRGTAAAAFDGDEVDLDVPATREPPRGPGELSVPRQRAAVPASSREWVPPASTQQQQQQQQQPQGQSNQRQQHQHDDDTEAPPDVSAISRNPAEEESIAVRLARRIAAQQRELDGSSRGDGTASGAHTTAAHGPPSAVKKNATSPSASTAASPSPSQKKTITFGADPRELRVPPKQQHHHHQPGASTPQRSVAAGADDDHDAHPDTSYGRSSAGHTSSAVDASAMSAQRQRNDEAHARNEADRIAIEDAKAELRRMERDTRTGHEDTKRALARREAEVTELRSVLERSAEALATQQHELETREAECRRLKSHNETKEKELKHREAALEAAATKAPEEAQRLKAIYAELAAREEDLTELQRECEALASSLARRERAVEQREGDVQATHERLMRDADSGEARLQEMQNRHDAAIAASRAALEEERDHWATEQDELMTARGEQVAKIRAADEALRKRQHDADNRERQLDQRQRELEGREAAASRAAEAAEAAQKDAVAKAIEATKAARNLEAESRALDQQSQRVAEREKALWRVTALTSGVMLGSSRHPGDSSKETSTQPPPPLPSLEGALDGVRSRLKAMGSVSASPTR